MSHLNKTERMLIKTRGILYTCDVTPALDMAPCAAGQSVKATLSLVLCRLFLVSQLLEFRDILWYRSTVGASMRSDLSTDQPAVRKLIRKSSYANRLSVWIMRVAVWRRHINWLFLFVHNVHCYCLIFLLYQQKHVHIYIYILHNYITKAPTYFSVPALSTA